ncbi:MAG: triose-phosphate isomerase [Bacilli bacterium]|jgi:triosephosphate isomerase|nr:triose-phosphate isomerase [Bacilli bacterium]
MRIPYIVGNWKMNIGFDEAYDFLEELNKIYTTEMTHNIRVGIALQAPLLVPMIAEFYDGNFLIGAQTCCDHLEGAYTGEISPVILAECETNFCIIGHSERRQYYNESDEAINTKAKLLLECGIEPIICVGETLEQFENNQTKEVIEAQIEKCCKDINISECVIAYEPVWAIGTGKSATSKIAQEVCHLIREKIRMMYPEDADNVIIQYGGSVNSKNIKELMACEDIDGALVGGASLKIDSFKELIKYGD